MNIQNESVKSLYLWKSVIQTMKKGFEEQLKEEAKLNEIIKISLLKIKQEAN